MNRLDVTGKWYGILTALGIDRKYLQDTDLVLFAMKVKTGLDSMTKMAEEHTSATPVVLAMALSYCKKFMAGVLWIV